MAKAKRKRRRSSHATTSHIRSRRTRLHTAPIRRKRRRSGLSAGGGLMKTATDIGLAIIGGGAFGLGLSMTNIPMLGMIAAGLGGAWIGRMINPALGAGIAGGFGSALAIYFHKKIQMQHGNLQDFADKNVFKALPIHDSDGHPLVIDESTGKAYAHDQGGQYRELTPAEYEAVKGQVMEHYGVTDDGMNDAYSLRDKYSLRNGAYALRG